MRYEPSTRKLVRAVAAEIRPQTPIPAVTARPALRSPVSPSSVSEYRALVNRALVDRVRMSWLAATA